MAKPVVGLQELYGPTTACSEELRKLKYGLLCVEQRWMENQQKVYGLFSMHASKNRTFTCHRRMVFGS